MIALKESERVEDSSHGLRRRLMTKDTTALFAPTHGTLAVNKEGKSPRFRNAINILDLTSNNHRETRIP